MSTSGNTRNGEDSEARTGFVTGSRRRIAVKGGQKLYRKADESQWLSGRTKKMSSSLLAASLFMVVVAWVYVFNVILTSA